MSTNLVEVDSLDEAQLQEQIEACDFLISVGYETSYHEELRSRCITTLQHLKEAQEQQQERPSAYPAPHRVKLLAGGQRSTRWRDWESWERCLGVAEEYVSDCGEYYDMVVHGRPRFRGDCDDVPRPCPFIGCRYNLWMRVLKTSRDIKPRDPAVMPWEVHPCHSCALDVVVCQPDGLTLSEVGEHFGVTRERIRMIETEVFVRLIEAVSRTVLEEYIKS